MKTLQVTQDASVARVRLNRPEVRNALHPDMIAEVTKTFKGFAKDKTLRAVVLSGEGKSFCAGADLEWMKSMARYTQAQNIKDAEKLFLMFQAIRDCEVPVIASVHGHAMGGALGLLAASDIVVISEETKLCFSEAKLGLAPAVISAFVREKISASAMSRWFLTAEVFSADRAREMGLVHEVCMDSQLEASVEKVVDSILLNGPLAVRESKKLVRAVTSAKSQAQLKTLTTRLIARLRVGEEAQQGMTSFFEQKPAPWSPRERNS